MARTIRDIMTTDLRTATPETPVRTVAQMMKEENVGSIPVVDGDKLVGIVTDRDLALSVVAEGKSTDAAVRDFMTTRPETVSPDSTVHEAGDIMQRHQIRRLPVCDGGRLVGIVALGDIAVETDSEGLKSETLEKVSESD